VANCNITGGQTTGGLAGLSYEACNINNCYSTGSVNGTQYVGGLVGNNGATMTNCYSRASVTPSSNLAGGLIGYNSASVTNCYSSGSVAGSNSTIGGLVGENGGTVTNSFWDTLTSEQATSDGGIAATTSQMTNTTTTDNIFLVAGWDFKGVGAEGIWNIGNGRNDGYPYLDWEYPSDPVTLPVELSAFTAQFIENTPTLYWETQSETDNMGWFVYRSDENDFTSSEKVSEFLEGYGTTTEQQSYIYEDNIENPEFGDTYYYWLESIDYSGIVNHYDKVAILTIPDQQDPGSGLIPEPERYGLLQNEPNPFIMSTKISFNLSSTAQVKLNIYNLKGQLVKSLYSGVASSKTLDWNGRDENGKTLSAGVYLYKLLINGKIAETKKLILMK